MGKKKGQKKGANPDNEWKDDGAATSLLDQVEITAEDSKQKQPKRLPEKTDDLEDEGENEAANDEPRKSVAPGGKKGKKVKKTFADIDWDDELKDDETNQPELVDITAATPVDPSSTAATGGKKNKKSKKKFADLDWDDELKDDEPSQPVNNEQNDDTVPVSDQPVPIAAAVVESGRKGKKKKKQKQDDYDDDIAVELEQLSLGTPDSHPAKAEPQADSSTNKTVSSTATEVGKSEVVVKKEDDKTDTIMAGDENNEGGGLRTAAQKHAEKKEREKEKKRKGVAKKKPPIVDEPVISSTVEESFKEHKVEGEKVTEDSKDIVVDPPAVVEGAVAMVEEEDDDTKDDKKKKKKKKKDKDTEKAAAAKTKKPGASALKRMKENLELLRLEQKKREEEELAKQKAEEEAEQRRLEKLHLEQERKEKKRQKEKERRERLKKEGKLLTKVEKEKKIKVEAQLKALQEQGVVVPARTHTQDGSDAVKKPVRYGTRIRNKQKKGANHSGVDENNEAELEEERATDLPTEGATGISTSQDNIPDTWEASSEEEGLKEHWDDENEDLEGDVAIVGKVVSKDAQLDLVPSDKTPVVTAAAATTMIEDEDMSEEEGSSDDEDDEDYDSSSSEEDSEEDEDSDLTPADKAKLKVVKRITKRREARDAARNEEAIRSPVVCVLGHVDTGKTKILDKIRHTNVQDGEAGGITQQIGATFVPDTAIREQTKFLKEFSKTEIRLPGLLIIDTPGHESFSNLRTRGSSMCDIAILVVDLMHGLEPQTIESLNLLKKKNVPFIVALNKIDRLFDWRRYPTSGVRECIKKQKKNTVDEFEERTKHVITELAEQGINAALFWEKVNFHEYYPVVPTSAISGDGMGDLIALLVTYSQKFLISSLLFSEELECIVLEVKAIAGLGTTVDVILRNGILREGDTIVLSGSEGPLVTQIRALLMPQPLKELRVKNAYVTHKLVPAAQGVKVTGKELEKALAGFPVFVAENPDEIDVFKDEAARQMKDVLSTVHTQERGVYVQASTLGSLEALLGFLKDSKIPYSGVNIGPVHKKDVMKCSVQLDRDSQWAVILAFDVRVEREAQEMADSVGVKIFTADIIYHLFDNFMKHRQELRDRKREEYKHIAVFPCKLRILPDCVFNARDPIVVGVVVEGGVVKPGTPIVVPSKNCLDLGVISSVEINHKLVETAHKGQEVAIKIESSSSEAPKLYGRHFDHTDLLVSKISRESIDAVKNYFREDLHKSDWQLMIELKKLQGVY